MRSDKNQSSSFPRCGPRFKGCFSDHRRRGVPPTPASAGERAPERCEGGKSAGAVRRSGAATGAPMPERAEERPRGGPAPGPPSTAHPGSACSCGPGARRSAADRSAPNRARPAGAPAAGARREQRRGELFNQDVRRRGARPPHPGWRPERGRLRPQSGGSLPNGPRVGAPERRILCQCAGGRPDARMAPTTLNLTLLDIHFSVIFCLHRRANLLSKSFLFP